MNYKEQLKHPKWQRKRLEIMQRDEFQCQCCFSRNKQLNVHHKIYKKGYQAWDYKDDVYITLCNDCHDRLHKIEFNKQYEKYQLTQTDFFILLERVKQMQEKYGIFWVQHLTDLLTAQVIKENEL